MNFLWISIKGHLGNKNLHTFAKGHVKDELLSELALEQL